MFSKMQADMEKCHNQWIVYSEKNEFNDSQNSTLYII